MTQQGRAGFDEIAHSFRSHWAQVDPFLLELFTSKFPTENRLALSFARTHPSLLATHSLLRNERKRVNNLQLQTQVHFLLPLRGQDSLWLRLSNDDVKAHFEWGKGWLRPYFSFSSVRKFNNSSFKMGASTQGQQAGLDLRFRYNIREHQADHFYYLKGRFRSENLRLSGIAAVLMKGSQVNLQKNDLMAAVQIFRDNWVGVVLDNQEFRKYRINYARLGSYFDSLKAVYLLTHQNLRLGLLYQYSIEDSNSKKIEAAVEYRCGRALERVKVRLNTQWKMGLSAEGGAGEWRWEGGAAWFNVNESLWPSFLTLALTYY